MLIGPLGAQGGVGEMYGSLVGHLRDTLRYWNHLCPGGLEVRPTSASLLIQ